MQACLHHIMHSDCRTPAGDMPDQQKGGTCAAARRACLGKADWEIYGKGLRESDKEKVSMILEKGKKISMTGACACLVCPEAPAHLAAVALRASL